MVGYPPNGMEADQCFVTVHWWVKMDLSVLVWWPLLPGRIWKSFLSLLEITDDDDMIGSINCPSIPRSSTLWTVTRIRKDLFIYYLLFFFFFFFSFFFCGCGAWGFAPHWLLNGGLTHIVATCLILIGRGVLFLVKTFSGFPHFSRQKPFDLLLSLFSFVTSSPSLCNWHFWLP